SKFLQAQDIFQKTLKPIYDDLDWNYKIEGLSQLSRLKQISKEMQDLNVDPVSMVEEQPNPSGFEAIGWLYCSEGSN
ncbi:biliverdin-producing heme oxygenase, partial [Acinetobacter baumannii]|nr:biliverdin-producing heme oxygenase [Acinetobacter baumannii]